MLEKSGNTVDRIRQMITVFSDGHHSAFFGTSRICRGDVRVYAIYLTSYTHIIISLFVGEGYLSQAPSLMPIFVEQLHKSMQFDW